MKTRSTTNKVVDLYVGAHLRYLRKQRGLSQAKLGQAIGMTFQQIQKYEKGTNRIACSTLHDFCTFFEVSHAEFFPDPMTTPRTKQMRDVLRMNAH